MQNENKQKKGTQQIAVWNGWLIEKEIDLKLGGRIPWNPGYYFWNNK